MKNSILQIRELEPPTLLTKKTNELPLCRLKYSLATLEFMGLLQFKLFGRNFTTLRMVKEYNKNFTEKSVAKANLPSKFPIFPKFLPALQNLSALKFVGCLKLRGKIL